MSKLTLKKHLQMMSKEEVVDFMLEVYQNSKQAKEFIEYKLNPNEKEQLEKYRKVIIEEFYPAKSTREPKTRFSICKKAIAEFKALKPDPKLIADLMMTLSETACKFTYDYGEVWEQFYDSTSNNYISALKYIQKNGLLATFKQRSKNCVKYSKHGGFGFEDNITDLYHEYYRNTK